MSNRISTRLPRRIFLCGFAGTLFGFPALAGGDGGGGGNVGLKKAPAIKDKYTQREFTKLTKGEISELYLKTLSKDKVTIAGFSAAMSTQLIRMASAYRRRTYRLVRDMGKLKTEKDRVARLNKELEKTYQEIAKLQEALNRAQLKNLKEAVLQTKQQISAAEGYQNGVKAWLNSADEGTR